MDPERIDLSPLDVTADRLGYERLVRRIMEAAAPVLARRAASANPLALLAGWARPTLAAAAVIALVALGALALTERAGAPVEETGTFAADLGLPAEAADWLTEGRAPTEYDLIFAMESR
ncbi:MAG TPA: hypothetical protein VMM12_12445 [Longimicrobiales bacterium]|nr:hypothetical protein [Longimicrobiales bacterium]